MALAFVAIAFTATLAGFNWLLTTYVPGLPPARLFIEADIIAQLVMLTLMLLSFSVLMLGVIGVALQGAARSMATVLRLAAMAAVGLGLLAAAYGWMTIQSAISRVGPVGIEVTAPSWAETLMVLALGLGVAGFALVFAVGCRLRAGERLQARSDACGPVTP